MDKFWEFIPQDCFNIPTNHSISRMASLFRKSGYREGYDLISGSIDFRWKFPKNFIDAESKREGDDLTKEITSKAAKFVADVDIIPCFDEPAVTHTPIVIPFIKFRYEINCEWPDVIFEIHLRKSIPAETMNIVESLFYEFVKEWNEPLDDESDDFIDYVGNAELTDNGTALEIHVDFGLCDPEKVLMPLLKHLSDSTLDIKKIILK